MSTGTVELTSDLVRAREIQESLRSSVRLTPLATEPRYVAGVDAAFFEDKIVAAACLFSYPEMEPVEEAYSIKDVNLPYIPGLLSFREGPALISAVERLRIRPDVIIFDGQGVAHPRGLGIASYAGVLLGMPTIGCAKSRLVGEFKEPGSKRGSRSPLKYKGKTVGAVVRTRDKTRPLFVSPGHLVDIEDSVRIVLGSAVKYRLTEPVRAADLLTKELKGRFS